ncbi:MAG: SAM-dependent methyltransferase [Clostridia bacterium]|nr:SAM-dependent methyltransferase [Clostridia bacterium]
MITPKLTKRLQAAGAFVRQGTFVADVGTDHAYLPIALVAEGRIRGGVVSDIHKGPILRATEHVAQYGMEGTLIPVLCDGLSELESYAPEDILILGMGGELIAGILDRAPWVRRSGIRLILQPMTHPERLRSYLAKEGFDILDETLVREEKIYQIILAEYSGQIRQYHDTELLFGPINISRGGELFWEMLSHWEYVLRERIRGKETAGADICEEQEILKEMEELRHEDPRDI